MRAMSDEASLRAQKSSKEAEKAQQEAYLKELGAKLERLYTAKKGVSDIKGLLNDSNKGMRKCKDQERWQGTKYNWYKPFVETTCYDEYQAYINSTDELLDRICDKITSLENECLNTAGVIGQLTSAINSLWNSIQKLFN